MPYRTCGSCLPCRRGRANCCERIQVLGVTVDGGMCERMVVPTAMLHASAELSWDQLALVEPLAIGWHAVERACPRRDDAALVLGAGPIGLAVALGLRNRVEDVLVSDVHGARLAFAAGLGLATVRADDGLADRIVEHRDGELPTLVFDATGSRASMERAFLLTGSGGTLVLVGHTNGPLTFDNPTFHARELDVRGSRNAGRDDWAAVLRAVCGGGLDAVPWISHRAMLHTIGDDLPQIAAAPDSVVKAVIDIGTDEP